MPAPKRVLIVEDDQDMVRFLAAIVEDEGFEALAVGDAFSGITEAVRERPVLIITDMQMPAGGGSVLLQRLRGNAKTSRIPIMVVTGTVDPSHEDELRQSGWYDRTAQAFAVFLPVRSVGVMGDGRTYEHVVALRAVQTTDFMTAHWAELPHDLLARVSNRIINEVRGINRVTYDITSKPPGTIEWE